MSSEPVSRPLRFWQFRIRDVLAITAICALALGWWCDRSRLRDQLERYRDRNNWLMAELGAARITLADAGINRSESICGIVSAVASTADGKLVEISLGKDDGLEIGTEMDVFRLGAEPTYLGRIKLTRVEPDISLGRVIAERPTVSIRRSDQVMARLPPTGR
jgi:hypothetical protein